MTGATRATDGLPEVSPEVSVVIPTHQRPALVVEAVASALNQTFRDLEVVVVVDGDDPATVAALSAIEDDRLRVILHAVALGNAAARNAGLDVTRGRWVALLDDDDLWQPEKIALQLAAGRAALARGVAAPVVSCRFVARTGTADLIWPRRLPVPGQAVSDYLFRRHRPTTGDGVVQTSTVLAPAALFRRVRFDPDCARFVDVDWLLRAAHEAAAQVVFAAPDRPLSFYRIEDRPRISNSGAWRDDVAWIRQRAHLVTGRATSSFLLTLASLRASREGDMSALPILLAQAVRAGRPGWAELVFHVANFAVPPRAARWLAARNAAGQIE